MQRSPLSLKKPHPEKQQNLILWEKCEQAVKNNKIQLFERNVSKQAVLNNQIKFFSRNVSKQSKTGSNPQLFPDQSSVGKLELQK